MPGPICGRRNDGKLYLSDWSGLYCRHGGPIDVLGRGYGRGETLICSLSFLLTACLGIIQVMKLKPTI